MLRPMIIATLCVAFAASAAVAAPEPKIDCENATATVEMNACVDRQRAAADAELNAVYKRALAAAPEMAGDPPYDAKSWEAALRSSQRAWVAFRDAECQGHAPMFWTGGTGATSDILGCETELTKARTQQLKARYEEGEAAPADAQ